MREWCARMCVAASSVPLLMGPQLQLGGTARLLWRSSTRESRLSGLHATSILPPVLTPTTPPLHTFSEANLSLPPWRAPAGTAAVVVGGTPVSVGHVVCVTSLSSLSLPHSLCPDGEELVL